MRDLREGQLMPVDPDLLRFLARLGWKVPQSVGENYAAILMFPLNFMPGYHCSNLARRAPRVLRPAAG